MSYTPQDPYSQQSSQNPSARQTRQGRNASSFNILSHSPSNSNYVDPEKQMRKERQNLYKDQLDHMVQFKQGKPIDNYNPGLSKGQSRERQGWGGEANPSAYPGHNYQEIQRGGPEAYAPEQQYQQQQQQNADYGLHHHASDIEKNYMAGSQVGQVPNTYAEYRRNSPPRNPTTVAKSFDTQDELRAQLLSKIRSGYNNQNYNVYSAYQKAHEEKEYQRQNFEHNVVDRYAREKVAKDQKAAMDDWERKKQMKQDMHESNKRAMEAKTSQKTRDKEFELYVEQKKIKDTIANQQLADAIQREQTKRMQNDNLSILKRQMEDSALRKFESKDHLAQPNFKVGGGYDSIDALTNQPLRNSSLNQDRMAAGYKPKQSEDLSIGMGNLNMGTGSGAYHNTHQDVTYGSRTLDNPVNPQPLSSRNQGASREALPGQKYDRFRHGTGFNIITGEYR